MRHSSKASSHLEAGTERDWVIALRDPKSPPSVDVLIRHCGRESQSGSHTQREQKNKINAF